MFRHENSQMRLYAHVFIRRTIVVFGTLVPWSHCKYCNAVGFGFCGAATRKLAAHLTRPQEVPFIGDIRVWGRRGYWQRQEGTEFWNINKLSGRHLTGPNGLVRTSSSCIRAIPNSYQMQNKRTASWKGWNALQNTPVCRTSMGVDSVESVDSEEVVNRNYSTSESQDARSTSECV